MKRMLYVCMTPGIKGPEAELTDEQTGIIAHLLDQLDQPWQGEKPVGTATMGTDVYMIDAWDDLSHKSLVLVVVLPSEFISVYTETGTADYIDTVGLWAYLAPIANEAIKEWQKNVQSQS